MKIRRLLVAAAAAAGPMHTEVELVDKLQQNHVVIMKEYAPLQNH